jgi:hypothetical protein
MQKYKYEHNSYIILNTKQVRKMFIKPCFVVHTIFLYTMFIFVFLHLTYISRVRVVVFNATIADISWRSVLLVEEIKVSRENLYHILKIGQLANISDLFRNKCKEISFIQTMYIQSTCIKRSWLLRPRKSAKYNFSGTWFMFIELWEIATVMVRKTPFLFLLDFLDFLTLLDKLNI